MEPHRTASVLGLPHWIRFLPIVWFELYLTGTVAMYAWGPWPWPTQDAPKLYGFLCLAHAALLVGYCTVRRRGRRETPGIRWLDRLVPLGAFIGLVLLIPSYIYRTGGVIGVESLLDNPGVRYLAARSAVAATTLSVSEPIRVLAYPILGALLPLTVFRWKSLTPRIKLAATLAIGGDIFVYFAIGTNKGLADAIILLPWLLVVTAFQDRRNWTPRVLRKLAGPLILGISLFLLFFGQNIAGRADRLRSSTVDYDARIAADGENGLVRLFPEGLQDGFQSFANYATQGYYALSLALEQPFVPCFGWGNSLFLMEMKDHFLRQPRGWSLQSTYPGRIRGWPPMGKWHTIYPWIASDVGFPGAIVVVFLIGRLLASSWQDAVLEGSSVAVVLLSYLLIMVTYFPCNNQILQGAESCPAFLITLAFWLWSRRKGVARL